MSIVSEPVPSGVERIRRAFERARESGRGCAVMPFVTAGYPTPAATAHFLSQAGDAGADLIEIGFPFSDPIADGPVIAESMHLALEGGVTPEAIFELVERTPSTVPLVAMVSVSIVERIGPKVFLERAVRAGFAGFIVPDADPIVARSLAEMCESLGAGWCPLVSPTTSDARRAEIAGSASGFVYQLARVGITGERAEAPDVRSAVEDLRRITHAPVAVGFGISRPEHVTAIASQADGAIIGSALVRAMKSATEGGDGSETAPAEAALELLRGLASGAASDASRTR